MIQRIRTLIEQGIHPHSSNEDEARREFILNVVLVGSIALTTVSDFVVAHNSLRQGDAYSGISFPTFSLIVAGFVLLYVLSRQGYWRAVSYVVISIYFAGAAYGSYTWGPNLPAALLSYALLIVMASTLISTRAGFVIACASAALTAALGYLEAAGRILPEKHWKLQPFNFGDAVEYGTMLIVIMIVSWLANREIEHSLSRARRSEAELTKERDLLEVKVEERTAELRHAQSQRMGQLYRFAKFGKLASGFFHDLMNPLTTMVLHVETIKTVTERDIFLAKDQLHSIRLAARKMEELMFMVKRQLNNQEIIETFSVRKTAEEVLQMLGHKAMENGVSLAVEDGVDAMFYYGNPIKVYQVILNIASNAIDACKEKEHGRRCVSIGITEEEGDVVIRVTDSGNGIARDIEKKIFDPFFTTKSAHDGIGLGLAIANDIVQDSLHGTITVQSREGEGSVFIVRFPIRRNHT